MPMLLLFLILKNIINYPELIVTGVPKRKYVYYWLMHFCPEPWKICSYNAIWHLLSIIFIAHCFTRIQQTRHSTSHSHCLCTHFKDQLGSKRLLQGLWATDFHPHTDPRSGKTACKLPIWGCLAPNSPTRSGTFQRTLPITHLPYRGCSRLHSVWSWKWLQLPCKN